MSDKNKEEINSLVISLSEDIIKTKEKLKSTSNDIEENIKKISVFKVNLMDYKNYTNKGLVEKGFNDFLNIFDLGNTSYKSGNWENQGENVFNLIDKNFKVNKEITNIIAFLLNLLEIVNGNFNQINNKTSSLHNIFSKDHDSIKTIIANFLIKSKNREIRISNIEIKINGIEKRINDTISTCNNNFKNLNTTVEDIKSRIYSLSNQLQDVDSKFKDLNIKINSFSTQFQNIDSKFENLNPNNSFLKKILIGVSIFAIISLIFTGITFQRNNELNNRITRIENSINQK